MSTIAFDQFALTRIADFARSLSRLHHISRRQRVDDDQFDREFNAVCMSVWGYAIDDISDDLFSAADHAFLDSLDEAQAHVKAHLKVQAVARAAAAGRSLSARELDAIAAGTTHDAEVLAEKDLERIAGGSAGKLQEAEDRTRVIAEKELAGISGGGSGGSIEVGRMIGGIFVPPDPK